MLKGKFNKWKELVIEVKGILSSSAPLSQMR